MDAELAVTPLSAHSMARQQGKVFSRRSVGETELDAYLSESATIGDFGIRINRLLRAIGIDAWSHSNANIVIDVLNVFGAWPAALIRQYAKEEFYRDDFIFRHMMASDQPLFVHRAYEFLSSGPLKSGSFTRNLEIYKLMQRHGMQFAFAIPIVGQRFRAVFTVSAKQGHATAFEATINRHLHWLQTLANSIDEVGRRKFAAYFHGEKSRSSIPINPKPLQLLTALATKDLTLNEAAEVLNISISTANQQIAAAKKAFRTTTTHGAIVAALLSGLIDLDI